jgi:hypothetical protein
MQESIDILKRLLKGNKGNKFIRRTELLADFSSGYAKDWYFCISKFFYEALDIKFTKRIKQNKTIKIWTQGSTFKFSVGDMIWNHAYPYCENFISEAIRSKIGIQVQSSKPCLPKTNNRKERSSGAVNFIILTENLNQDSKAFWKIVGNYSLSQDDFVKFLITGYCQSLELDLKLGLLI